MAVKITQIVQRLTHSPFTAAPAIALLTSHHTHSSPPPPLPASQNLGGGQKRLVWTVGLDATSHIEEGMMMDGMLEVIFICTIPFLPDI